MSEKESFLLFVSEFNKFSFKHFGHKITQKMLRNKTLYSLMSFPWLFEAKRVINSDSYFRKLIGENF